MFLPSFSTPLFLVSPKLIRRQSHLLLILLLACTLGCHAQAEALPPVVHIDYEVLLGSGFRIGRAEQDWKLSEGRYTLETRLTPMLGPRIRYISTGRLGKQGLVPEYFAEFRNDDESPRISTRFDWQSKHATLGPNDDNRVLDLESGAQDVNAFVFQLVWLGDKTSSRMQIATGRNLRQDHFALAEPTIARLADRDVRARVWKSQDSESRTTVWLAPELGNLPVRVQRQDDRAEVILAARQITYEKSKNENKP